MKKMVALCLLLCFLLSCMTGFAENAGEKEEKPVYTLTLLDAIEMARKDNAQLMVYDVQEKSAKFGYEVQRELKKAYKNVVIHATNSMEMAYVKDGYYTEVFLMQERLAKEGKKKQENVIAYQVTEKYYRCKQAEGLVKVMRDTLAIAEQNKKTVDAQYALGLISQMTVTNAEIAVEQSRLSLESYERSLLLAYDNLKIDLHLDGIDCALVLTDEITCEDYISDVNKDLEKAMETRYDVKALVESTAMSKRYFDITASHSSAEVASYQSAYADYLSAKNTQDTSVKQIALGIKSYYNAILTAKGDLTIAEKTLELKQSEYDAAKLKYEMGMISNMELTRIMNEVSAQQINVENAKATYRLAVEKYQYEIRTGL